MAPIYTHTDSSSDKEEYKNASLARLSQPERNSDLKRKWERGKNYEGYEGAELTKLKHNLLYSWGNFMAKTVKDHDTKKQTDGNVLQSRFTKLIDKIHLHNCQ